MIVTTWGVVVVPWHLEGGVPDTLVSGLRAGSGSESHAEGVLQAPWQTLLVGRVQESLLPS